MAIPLRRKSFFNRNFLKSSCAIIFILLGPLFSIAQSAEKPHLFFAQKKATVTSGAITQLKLVVKNPNSQNVDVRLSLKSPEKFQQIMKVPNLVSIAAGDSIVVPVEIYVPKRLKAKQPYEIRALAEVQGHDKETLEAICKIEINEDLRLFINAVNPDVYMYSVHDTTKLGLHITNAGNIDRRIQLRSDNFLISNYQAASWVLDLKSFSDTTIYIKGKFTTQFQNQNSGNIFIQVKDANSNFQIINTVFFIVHYISSIKSYAPSFYSNSAPTNSVGFYNKNVTSPYSFQQLQAKGDFQAKGLGLSTAYNLDFSYFPQFQNIILQNSNLRFTSKKMSLLIGSFYHNDELALNGRGIQTNFSIKRNKKLELGYVNNAYNLLNSFDDPYFRSSNTLFAKYSFNTDSKKEEISTSLFQQWDPQNKVNKTLSVTESTIKLSAKQTLELAAAESLETTAGYVTNAEQKIGYAGKANYQASFEKFNISSNNYISNPYYAGLQRGTLNLSENIVYTGFKGLAIWSGYNKTRFCPSYLGQNYQLFNFNFNSDKIEAGITKQLGNSFNASLSPFILRQLSITEINRSSFVAKRAQVNLNYTISPIQSVFITADIGSGQSTLNGLKKLNSWTLNANYTFKNFSVYAFIQQGPYYMSDMAFASDSTTSIRRYTINPQYSGYFFKGNLQLRMADNISYDNNYKRWMNNVSANFECKLPASFSLKGEYYKTYVPGVISGNSQINLGVVKSFNNNKGIEKNANLELFFFKDENGNLQKDANEQPAQNLLVRINDVIFTTDNNGKVLYRKVPANTYLISLLNASEWYMPEQRVTVSKNSKLTFSLYKNGTIKGKLQLTQVKNAENGQSNLSEISVIAESENGKVFTALASNTGEFMLYVPENKYTLRVDANTVPENYEIETPPQLIKVLRNQLPPVVFDLSIKERKVKIKKFQSSVSASKKK
ncbi:hypothetical protein [Solitalea koreensis]|uniref:Uncharacterized protein n=1 Tax=Solitalea koreensis TaxID=543615 RepID=A0A521C3D9_9SPHI|nr:hypothetical protein [Solitalea koreensis]SMO53962.1 hypothetical protein SAMN06265350_103184 [Solitalea koreensis]